MEVPVSERCSIEELIEILLSSNRKILGEVQKGPNLCKKPLCKPSDFVTHCQSKCTHCCPHPLRNGNTVTLHTVREKIRAGISGASPLPLSIFQIQSNCQIWETWGFSIMSRKQPAVWDLQVTSGIQAIDGWQSRESRSLLHSMRSPANPC